MDFLATPRRRKILFAALYFSEGAPIGFIWVALLTWVKSAGVSIENVTWLAAVVVLPWTVKFAWAPLVDGLQTRWWSLKHWLITAQCVMGATLLPLLWLDFVSDFYTIALLLVVHALAAATQDVSIDALCISSTRSSERGEYNGWMQAGMLVGRALMGGGALLLAELVGERAVVLILVAVTTSSLVLVVLSRLPTAAGDAPIGRRAGEVMGGLARAVGQRNTWLGLLFALLGGAAFKALEVVLGPFLLARCYTKAQIGQFTAGPMILCMILGSVTGGMLVDRIGHRRFVAVSLLFIVGCVANLAVSDLRMHGGPGYHLLLWLSATAFGIGLFTASSYALFMDITSPRIAATQFSAFMGATNGCESWSSWAVGLLIVSHGYPVAFLCMAAVSLLALPLVAMLKPDSEDQP
jgi:MFS family permease